MKVIELFVSGTRFDCDGVWKFSRKTRAVYDDRNNIVDITVVEDCYKMKSDNTKSVEKIVIY